MIEKLASRVDVLARRLPDSEPQKAEFRSRIAALGQECGCQTGGIFLVAAMALVVVYFVAVGRPGIVTGLLAVVFVFTMSLLGKVVGLTVARLRLLAVRRAVRSRLSENGVGHVYVH